MTRNDNLPQYAVEPLIAHYGKLRLMWAVLRANPGKRSPSDAQLSDYLRRDIGLTERAPPSKEWERHR